MNLLMYVGCNGFEAFYLIPVCLDFEAEKLNFCKVTIHLTAPRTAIVQSQETLLVN